MGEDFYQLAPAFLKSVGALIIELPQAIAAADAKETERLVHSIKSAAANVCATTLSELAQQMEIWAKKGELEQVAEQLASLKQS